MSINRLIDAVMPSTITSEKLTYTGLSVKINLSGVVRRSSRGEIVFDGSIQGFVNDKLSSLFGNGGSIGSLRMMSGGILVTEAAFTNPIVRGKGINTILYQELVNTYFPQAQIVENYGTYGAGNARRILEGRMSVKQMAFYRIGWLNYRARNSLADFFVRPGASPPLMKFPHMERIF